MGKIVKLMHARRNEQAYCHPAWISRARSRMRGSRGATLVEAAFVTPIFLLFIMAIAESGLYMRNYLGVANAVRAGARSASAGGNDAGGLGAETPSADLYTVLSVARESAAIPRAAIQYVVVYKAAGFGAQPTAEEEDGVPSGCLNGRARAGLCNVYTTADFVAAEVELRERTRNAEAMQTNPDDPLDMTKMTFGCGPSSPDRFWCPTDRKVALRSNGGLGPDYVGVYMKIRHDWLTNIFGDGRFIDDQSVIKIEPQQTNES